MGVPKFFRWLSERYPVVNQRYGCPVNEETCKAHGKAFPPDPSLSPHITADPLSTCSVKPEIDRLYIDMNGIIHCCAHNNNSSNNNDDTEVASPVAEEDIFRNVCFYLDRVIEITDPTELVYMAIDGVAPRAKLNQQRARRYRSGKEGEIEQTVYDAHVEAMMQQQQQQMEEELPGEEKHQHDHHAKLKEVEPGRFVGKFTTSEQESVIVESQGQSSSFNSSGSVFFHSNSITPGTPFFQRCTKHIQHYIRYKQTHDPKWQRLKIIFSGPNVPGEGEHKIMQFMREQQQHSTTYHVNLRHCIMGQDGDLIMLGLATHEPNLVLLREQVLFDTKAKSYSKAVKNATSPYFGLDLYLYNENFEFLHMNVLRDYLSLELECSNIVHNSPWDLEHCIDDFVFMTFLVGNDFLPHMPALDIADEAFDLLLYTYREQRKTWLNEKDRVPPYLTKAGNIVQGKRLEQFLSKLGSHESNYHKHKQNQADADLEIAKQYEKRFGMNTIPEDSVRESKEASDRAKFRAKLQVQEEQQPTTITANFQPVLSATVDFQKQQQNQKQEQQQKDEEEDQEGIFMRMANLLQYSVTDSDNNKQSSNQNEKTEVNENTKSTTLVIDDQDLKGRYYSDKFGFGPFDAEQHLALRKSYLEGLVWNLKYYYQGCVSWDWYYPYHYGPMLSDLVDLDELLQDISFDSTNAGQPLKPFEQLMACMPPSHADVLPEPYRPLMTDKDSPIADFYPRQFTVDMNGKRTPWEAVVLLPFIDSQRLLAAVNAQVEPHMLSEEEKERNRFEKAVLFMYDDSSNTNNNNSSPTRVDGVGEGEIFGDIEKCASKSIPFEESPLHYNKKDVVPCFQPTLRQEVEVPLPGFPTLRDGSVQSLWRKLLRINVHGNRSRYKTACLEITNAMPEVLPIEALAPEVIGSLVYINYPHFIEAFVTAISNSSGIIRGPKPMKPWNPSEAFKRTHRMRLNVSRYVFGGKLVGTGGITLVDGNDSMDELEVLLHVRPMNGTKTLGDGTVVKTYANFEVEVPLFVMSWAPVKEDARFSNLPARLEKDPYHAAENVVTGKGFYKPSERRQKQTTVSGDHHPASSRKKTRRSSYKLTTSSAFTKKQMISRNRGYHTVAGSTSGWNVTIMVTTNDRRAESFSELEEHFRSFGITHAPVNKTVLCQPLRERLPAGIQGGLFESLPPVFRPAPSRISNPSLPQSLVTSKVVNPNKYSNVLPGKLSSRTNTNTMKKIRYSNSRGRALAIGALAAMSYFSAKGADASSFGQLSTELSFHQSYLNGDSKISVSSTNSLSDLFGDSATEIIQKRRTPPLEFAHGTTTLSFVFQGGIVCAVDSRASLGSFVGSKTTQKVLPINSHILGTMAGGAADCSFWIRKLRSEAALHELTEGRRMSVARASRLLSNALYENRGLGLSVGTMIMGFDDQKDVPPKIFYVDNSGMRIEGDLFAVGSGSTFALGILDTERRHDLPDEEAVALGIKAIRHATFRDASSGGFINIYLITREGWKRVFTEDLDGTLERKDLGTE